VTMGYLENERATRETFEPDGWLHSGDLGMVDKDGFITILVCESMRKACASQRHGDATDKQQSLFQDRFKELIKVKGIQVAPAELEDLLLGNPLVEDVAVIGIAHDYAGEVPKAYVVLKEDEKTDEERARDVLTQYVRERLSRHKWLDGGIEFVDEIPKSTSGKILRRVLKERHLAEGQKARAVKL
jgi:4-coumarate--CoA ligase